MILTNLNEELNTDLDVILKQTRQGKMYFNNDISKQAQQGHIVSEAIAKTNSQKHFGLYMDEKLTFLSSY